MRASRIPNTVCPNADGPIVPDPYDAGIAMCIHCELRYHQACVSAFTNCEGCGRRLETRRLFAVGAAAPGSAGVAGQPYPASPPPPPPGATHTAGPVRMTRPATATAAAATAAAAPRPPVASNPSAPVRMVRAAAAPSAPAAPSVAPGRTPVRMVRPSAQLPPPAPRAWWRDVDHTVALAALAGSAIGIGLWILITYAMALAG